jgi:hypothetical protein
MELELDLKFFITVRYGPYPELDESSQHHTVS